MEHLEIFSMLHFVKMMAFRSKVGVSCGLVVGLYAGTFCYDRLCSTQHLIST